MKPRTAAVVAAGWVLVVAAAALSVPGRTLSQLGLFPWVPFAAPAPYLGTGTPLALARAAGLVLAATVLAALLGCAGSGLARWLGFRAVGGVERAAVAVLLGTSACGTVFLGLGLAGAFSPGVLVVALVALAAAGGTPALPRRPAGPPVGLLVVIAFLALQFVPYWFCPETDQDALNFHLALPERFLRLRRIQLDPLVASTYAFRPAPADLVYAIPVAAGGDAIARLLHGVFLLAGLGLVFGFVERRAGRTYAWLAVALCAAPVSLANTAARAKNDLAAAAAAAGAWLVWLEGPRVPGRVLVSAAVGGYAVAFKLTSAAVVLPWMICAAACSGGIRSGAVAIIVPVLALSPWLLRNWFVAGDPLYPHLSPRWFPGLAWGEGNRELNRAIYRYMSYRGASPVATAGGLLRLDVPFLVAALPAAVMLRGIPVVAAAAAVVAYAASVAVQPAARYTIPAVWVLTALLVPALASLPGGRILRAGAVLLAVLPALFRFPAAATMADDRVRVGNPWPYLLGGQSHEGFMAERLTTYRAMALALPGLVAPGRAVLLHHDARTYGLPRPGLRGQEDADEPVLRRLSRESMGPADLARKLRQINAGALAINPVIAFRYLTEAQPLPWDDRSLKVYRDFAARRVAEVWNSPTEDDLNGAYTVLVLGRRDRAPHPVPLLPGTAPVWSRASWRLVAGAVRPDPGIERELLAIRVLLPGVGEAACRLGHYFFVTGARARAAEWYRRAMAEGYVDGRLLARLALSLPEGRERDGVTGRLRARCGTEADGLLADAARWVR